MTGFARFKNNGKTNGRATTALGVYRKISRFFFEKWRRTRFCGHAVIDNHARVRFISHNILVCYTTVRGLPQYLS